MFAFRLALELGIWDVDGMLESMPAPLFWEWHAALKVKNILEEQALNSKQHLANLKGR